MPLRWCGLPALPLLSACLLLLWLLAAGLSGHSAWAEGGSAESGSAESGSAEPALEPALDGDVELADPEALADENASVGDVLPGDGCEPTIELNLPEVLLPTVVAYRSARCLEAEGHLEEADVLYRQALEGQPVVPGLFHLARIRVLLTQGKHAEASAALRALWALPQSKRFRKRVRGEMQVAEEAAPVSNRAARAALLDAYLAHGVDDKEDHGLIVERRALAAAANETEQQQEMSLRLWRYPRDKASAAESGAWPGSEFKGLALPTAADRLTRAHRLFSLRQFSLLASELEEGTFAATETEQAKALGRLYFRALIRGGNLSHAAVQIHTPSVMERFAFDRRQQVIWTLRIQQRRRLFGPVLKYLAELERIAPQDDEIPAVMLELYKYNLTQSDAPSIAYWFDRLTKEFPGSQAASDVRWRAFWNAWRSQRPTEAALQIDAALAASEHLSGVDQARLHYWKGRALMAGKQSEQGLAIWSDVRMRWPYGFYAELTSLSSGTFLPQPLGLRAASLPVVASAPAAKADGLVPHEYFAQGLVLLAVGERGLARLWLADAVVKPLPPEAVEEAGALLLELGEHHLLLRLVGNHRLADMRAGQVERSSLWLRAFPRPHWPLVREQADALKIDPYFALAVMREESRFYVSADSTAGAQGLMQLMPDTARWISKRSGLPYLAERLNEPEINVPLGIYYLHQMAARFKGNPAHAAAAYNAGPGAVRRWLKQFGEAPLDEFVERIPYEETQNYVRRVLLSYRIYDRLYREVDAGSELSSSAEAPAAASGG